VCPGRLVGWKNLKIDAEGEENCSESAATRVENSSIFRGLASRPKTDTSCGLTSEDRTEIAPGVDLDARALAQYLPGRVG